MESMTHLYPTLTVLVVLGHSLMFAISALWLALLGASVGYGHSFLLLVSSNRQNSSENRFQSTRFASPAPILLDEYLKEHDVDKELHQVLQSMANACLEISQSLQEYPLHCGITNDGTVNVQGEVQKTMDVLANDIVRRHVAPKVAKWVSEEEAEVQKGTPGKRYQLAVDPLDGSSNVDVSLPTGTIFGITRASDSFLCAGRDSLVAAGYVLYSSCTELVLCLNHQQNSESNSATSRPTTPLPTVGFLASPQTHSFCLCRPHIQCPESGPYYSLNEAREPDWPAGLRRWVHDAKHGLLPSCVGAKLSSRYVCALVADVHRTLLTGGWAGNPRRHLRILYEAAPLALLVHGAGGRASNGCMDLLDVEPTSLHDRTAVFVGSSRLIGELVEDYGDVVQQGTARYEA